MSGNLILGKKINENKIKRTNIYLLKKGKIFIQN